MKAVGRNESVGGGDPKLSEALRYADGWEGAFVRSARDNRLQQALTTLAAEVRRLRAELSRLQADAGRMTLALQGYGKHPEECADKLGGGACVSHMAYESVTAFLRAEGYDYDDDKETWVKVAITKGEEAPPSGRAVVVPATATKPLTGLDRSEP